MSHWGKKYAGLPFLQDVSGQRSNSGKKRSRDRIAGTGTQ